jgi:ABC-type multidrug transport system permease subunit
MGNMNRSKVIQILHEKYLESDLCVQMMKPSDKAPQLTNQQNTDTFDSRYPTPWYYQFRVIFSRYFLYKLREPVAAMTMLTNSIFMAVLLGIIFYKPPLVDTFVQTRLAAASFVIIVQAFLAYDIILLWPKERAVYLEEHSTGLYSTGSFYWARTLCDAPFHFACGIIIGSITYWMFGFQVDASKFFIFMAFIQLVTFCGTSLFLMLSSLSQTMEQANLLATLVLSLFVLFNGTFTNAKTTPSYLKWMESVSFINHGVQVLAKNEYSGLSFSCSGDLGVQCAFTSGDSFLNFLGYSDVSEWKSALILIGMIVVYRFAAYLGVKYLYTGKSLKELIKNKSE